MTTPTMDKPAPQQQSFPVAEKLWRICQAACACPNTCWAASTIPGCLFYELLFFSHRKLLIAGPFNMQASTCRVSVQNGQLEVSAVLASVGASNFVGIRRVEASDGVNLSQVSVAVYV